MRTIDAIEYFGSKAKAADALGITRAAANRWGYWLPMEAAHRLSLSLDKDSTAKTRLSNAKAVFKDSSEQVKALEKELADKKKIADESLKFEPSFYKDPEVVEIDGNQYKPATDIKTTSILSVRLGRGEVFHFFNHDEMECSRDLTEAQCLTMFKLYPIYREVV